MHKSQYNQLMKSKEAQSFGTLGPNNSITMNMHIAHTNNTFLNASESHSLTNEAQTLSGGHTVGTQANAGSLTNIGMAARNSLKNLNE